MKKFKFVAAFLSVFVLTGCNFLNPESSSSLPVDFDFNPTSTSAVTVDDYDTKEIKIKFKDESCEDNAKKKIWTIDEKSKDYIAEIKDTNKDDTTFKFKALKPTEAGKPAKLKITVTSRDNKVSSTISKTCNITINQHAHKKSDWKGDDTKHWKECEVCGKKLDIAAHYSNTWKNDETYHWKECDTCNKVFNKSTHNPSATWKHNETQHWHECLTCGQKTNETAHTFNNENNCEVCSYHDPMFIVNEAGVLTGLTNLGKAATKLEKDETVTKNDFGKAYIIGENAFAGCNPSTEIIVPENVMIIHKDVFANFTNVKYQEDVTAGSSVITWTPVVTGSDYKVKNNLAENNEAFVNGLFYPTLKDAINSVQQDNTIIKLLKPNLSLQGQDTININHNIYIESLVGTTNITNASFSVNPNKVLFFDDTVSFKGNVNLFTKYETDRCGSYNFRCYTPGTVVFPSKPLDGVNVYYSIDGQGTKTALGANQKFVDIYGKLITVHSFGTFKFNELFNSIVGLTDFGNIITELTISEFLGESRIDDLSISACAFNIEENREVSLTVEGVKKTISVHGCFQKGIFEKAIIDVKEIGMCAFDASFERTQSLVEQEQIQTVVSKLSEVEILSSVVSIDEGAFRECCSLKTITDTTTNGDSNLEVIKNKAFYRCAILKTVNFGSAKSLTRIEQDAFGLCLRLDTLRVGTYNAWQTEDGKNCFAAEDLNETTFAYLVALVYNNYNLISNSKEQAKSGAIYIYHPDDHDEYGYHNKVTNLNHIYQINDEEIYKNIKNGSILCVTQDYFDKRYYEADQSRDITIRSNHSLYIKNDSQRGSDNDNDIQLKSIKVESGAYALLDSRIKVTNGIELYQPKDCKDCGGVAFVNRTQHNNDTVNEVKISLNGEKTVKAKGFPTSLDFNGKTINYCNVYGTATFEYGNDPSKKPCEKLVKLSSIGRICKHLEIQHQAEGDLSELIVVQPEFSTSNNIVESITFDNDVKIITNLDKKEYRVNKGSFNDCSNLGIVTFQSGSKLEILDPYSFANCPKLSSCTLQNCKKLYCIEEGCFQNDSLLTEIILPDDNKDFFRIEEHAFLASGLKKFHMPSGILTNWHAGDWEIERHYFTVEEMAHEAGLARYLTINYVEKDLERGNK